MHFAAIRWRGMSWLESQEHIQFPVWPLCAIAEHNPKQKRNQHKVHPARNNTPLNSYVHLNCWSALALNKTVSFHRAFSFFPIFSPLIYVANKKQYKHVSEDSQISWALLSFHLCALVWEIPLPSMYEPPFPSSYPDLTKHQLVRKCLCDATHRHPQKFTAEFLLISWDGGSRPLMSLSLFFFFFSIFFLAQHVNRREKWR